MVRAVVEVIGNMDYSVEDHRVDLDHAVFSVLSVPRRDFPETLFRRLA
jgi:hypothetical protein